jgi:hypothetical protein
LVLIGVYLPQDVLVSLRMLIYKLLSKGVFIPRAAAQITHPKRDIRTACIPPPLAFPKRQLWMVYSCIYQQPPRCAPGLYEQENANPEAREVYPWMAFLCVTLLISLLGKLLTAMADSPPRVKPLAGFPPVDDLALEFATDVELINELFAEAHVDSDAPVLPVAGSANGSGGMHRATGLEQMHQHRLMVIKS